MPSFRSPQKFFPTLRANRFGIIVHLCLLLCLAFPSAVLGAATPHPGFRSFGLWDEQKHIRMDVSVWYPTQRQTRTLRLGDYSFKASQRGKPLDGAFPLILVSPDTPGNRFAYHTLATNLCVRGFIIAVPTHAGDNDKDMRHMLTAKQFVSRVRELRCIIDTLCTDPDLGPHLDANRIGVIGFGMGATTALAMAGAKLDGTAWKDWSRTHSREMEKLSGWMRNKLERLAEDPELSRTEEDNRVRAIACVSPALSPFFSAASFARLRVPVLLAATAQNACCIPLQSTALIRAIPTKTRYVRIPDALPADFMDVPDNVQDWQPGYHPLMPGRQELLQTQAEKALADFFQKTICDPLLPPPPPPLPPVEKKTQNPDEQQPKENNVQSSQKENTKPAKKPGEKRRRNRR